MKCITYISLIGKNTYCIYLMTMKTDTKNSYDCTNTKQSNLKLNPIIVCGST